MAIVTATGNVSTILNYSTSTWYTAEYLIENAVSDFLYGIDSFDETYYDNTTIAGDVWGWGSFGYSPTGFMEITGSGFMGTSGTIKSIEMWMHSGYSLEILGNVAWSERAGLKGGTLTSVEFQNPSLGLAFSVKGSLKLDSSFNVTGSISQVTNTINGITTVEQGTFKYDDAAGSKYSRVTWTDSSGTLDIKASIAVGTVPAETVGEVFDQAFIFQGNDVFNVSANNRAWNGFGGNDKMTGGDLNDTLYGGDGNDQIRGNGGDDWLSGDAGNDKIWGGAGNDVIYGGDGNDQLFGEAGDDYIDGGAGNDKIVDLEGNNIIVDLEGNANISTGTGDDVIITGAGNDKIVDRGGSNLISTGAGNDKITVTGTASDTNIIIGGQGSDVIKGSASADTFVFDNLAVGGFDKISGFDLSDRFAFDTDVFASLSGGITADNVRIGAGATAAQTDSQYLVFDSKSGKLYYDADGNGAEAAVLVATVKGNIGGVTADHFTTVSGFA